jgi:hypothetical protein
MFKTLNADDKVFLVNHKSKKSGLLLTIVMLAISWQLVWD